MKIALLGSRAHSTTSWCVQAAASASLDPSASTWTPDDPAWSGIDWSSGDEVQPVVDAILQRQMEGIASCDVILAYLDAATGPGARLEFGRLLMGDRPLYVVLAPDLQGRHYIRSHYAYARVPVVEYTSIDAAVSAILAACR